ncbi:MULTISPECIES: hypothetical protein [unclassified Bradyrhizobium]|uniref:hypothetical protein n=1 Tax=unclassified Bradyrhizobium TaxID=2631580 RepID=UPI0024E18D41|nr:MULTISPECIES: hypothetical protein [unclassified Bradyrhizobium]
MREGNHEFRKSEIQIFLREGLDRESAIESADEIRVPAQRMTPGFQGARNELICPAGWPWEGSTAGRMTETLRVIATDDMLG